MKTAYDVIISPIISEQTMDLAREKKYAFKVAPTANKSEIKQAVEEIEFKYGVNTNNNTDEK